MIKSITSVKVTGRRVIIRAGFDVPLEKNIQTEQWQVADDTRIRDILPTLNYLIEQKAKIIIMAHLGRPEGWQTEKSLWPVAEKLGELIDYSVTKVSDKLPDYAVAHVNFLTSDITKRDYSRLSQTVEPGSILFLENLRFYKGEEANETKFINLLAGFGDVYVNDAFSAAHRKESSTFGLAAKLPHYAGVDFLKEIQSLNKIIKNPRPPLIVLIGGAKIADKVPTIANLAKYAQAVLIGGATANAFLKAKGYEIGKSKVTDVILAKDLLRQYKDKIILPIDVVVAGDLESKPRLVAVDKVMPNDLILDIGPESIRKFSKIIREGKTLVWNGPFGLIEKPRYAFGSKSIAHIFATRSKGSAFGVIGGGETIEVVDQAKVAEYIDHVSMGGGAMLEFLAGTKLPAIKALEEK